MDAEVYFITGQKELGGARDEGTPSHGTACPSFGIYDVLFPLPRPPVICGPLALTIYLGWRHCGSEGPTPTSPGRLHRAGTAMLMPHGGLGHPCCPQKAHITWLVAPWLPQLPYWRHIPGQCVPAGHVAAATSSQTPDSPSAP